MSAGLRNAAIAERLLVSEATVRKHIGRISRSSTFPDPPETGE